MKAIVKLEVWTRNLNKWDKENAPGHPNLNDVLTNITLEFLPKNSTQVIQPCDAGIIRCFKAHFRNESSQKVRYLMEETGKDAMDCTKIKKCLDPLRSKYSKKPKFFEIFVPLQR